MVRISTHRPPNHPGEMLLKEFLKPLGITQKELSDSIHVPCQHINEVINQKRGITPSTALRLAKYFGVYKDFWLNIQLRWDIFKARKKETAELKKIRPYKSSHHGIAHL